METIFSQSSPDQSFSPCNKQIKNNKKYTRSLIRKPSENMQRGLLLAPPHLSYSYPPPLSLHNYQQQQPPPLLPLPIIPNKTHSSSRSRNLSCPPTNRKSNRTRDQSLTPKKSKQATIREEEPKPGFIKPTEKTIADSLIFTSVNPLGPDPNDLPKDVSKVLSAGLVAVKGFEFEKFSGSVFTVSPPPSSLPLPKFSLRPKLTGCNAEAAGIDAGATDNLRRLLRLP